MKATKKPKANYSRTVRLPAVVPNHERGWFAPLGGQQARATEPVIATWASWTDAERALAEELRAVAAEDEDLHLLLVWPNGEVTRARDGLPPAEQAQDGRRDD